jgi:cobyrinic acid a,c-diamide synthase
VAAPHSGSGKTLVTLGLVRALRRAGHRVAACKAGPDYIDPQFHSAASGRECLNLDLWAMGESMCGHLLNQQAAGSDIVIVEGVMGLFDGPEGARGSTADLAVALNLPVLLVIDCAHQAQSVAALLQGFAGHRPDVTIAGVFLNRVKSDRHAALLRQALLPLGVPMVGQLRHTDSLTLPSRHLGLVQAIENQALELTLESAASAVARETILDKLFEIALPVSNQTTVSAQLVPPLGQNIAVARDEAFAFAYAHMLRQWREAGATLSFFSPLADAPPPRQCDAVFLPGGYPELHAGKLASNQQFLHGLRQFGGLIYGECGGYMVLGEGLTDAAGITHAMAGLLPLETSFATRKLHLGYRALQPLAAPWTEPLHGHEFHYATILREGDGARVFGAATAAGAALPPMGLRRGKVVGSFAHVIGVAP